MAKRYWQAGKGWIGRPPGNGHDWLHIETTAEAWDVGRSVEERTGGATTPERGSGTVAVGSDGSTVRRRTK